MRLDLRQRPRLPIVGLTAALATAGLVVAPAGVQTRQQSNAPSIPSRLWVDATSETIGETKEWTNKVEVADLDADGRPDLIFANGGNYSEPGPPELSRVFFNQGPGRRFVERTSAVFGATPALSRVIKARDVSGDGLVDILVGTTYQTQSRLYLGTGGGSFRDATGTHLPQVTLSVGDLEFGDVDGDGDLDVVLADWGAGNNMTNAGGRVRLWLNDGSGRFTDATNGRMPEALVRFSWDLELVDTDNDYDLDVLVSCKRCAGSYLFRNDGTGTFADESRVLPAYTNNYDFEAMDLDGDTFLDLATINDGDIVNEVGSSRREHVFRNDGRGRYRDATTRWWPPESNIGEDDNIIAFLDFDSDGDADFVVGSLSGPDRLLINDGTGRLTLARDVFDGPETPGTLGLALADLDGDGRMDVIQAQGEHPTAVQERVFLGRGLQPDTSPPSVTIVDARKLSGHPDVTIRARVHDRKSPLLATELKSVEVRWDAEKGRNAVAMRWYGEYLWRVEMPLQFTESTAFRVCATDASGNSACASPATR